MALVGEDGVHARVVVVRLGEVGGVGDDEDVVPGDGEVKLEGFDSEADGVLEGGESVLGASGAASAVSVDLNGLRLGGEGQSCGEQEGG
jgi:hypothetical protein